MTTPETSLGFSGHYKIEHVRGGRVIGVYEFKNMLMDKFFNDLFTTSYYTLLYYFKFGIGTTPPTVLDYDLQTVRTGPLYASPGGGTVVADSMYTARVTSFSYTVTTPFEAGLALSELGMYNSNGDMYSRTLILDTLGNPTTILTQLGDTINTTYELRMYFPVPVYGTMLVTGTGGGSWDYSLAPYDVTTWHIGTTNAAIRECTRPAYRHYNTGATPGQAVQPAKTDTVLKNTAGEILDIISVTPTVSYASYTAGSLSLAVTTGAFLFPDFTGITFTNRPGYDTAAYTVAKFALTPIGSWPVLTGSTNIALQYKIKMERR